MTEQKNRREFESNLAIRAGKNKSFKQKLINNSKAVHEGELGQSLPEDISIQVIQVIKKIKQPRRLSLCLKQIETKGTSSSQTIDCLNLTFERGILDEESALTVQSYLTPEFL
jgi:hypothetical protein